MNPIDGPRAIPVEPASCQLCGASGGETLATGTDYEYGMTNQTFRFVRCRSCSHVYLDPRPTRAAAPLLYPDNYYTVSGSHRTGAFALLGMVKDAVLARRVKRLVGDLGRGAAVLDVGCGDGALLLALRRARPDLVLAGLDLRMGASARGALDANGIASIEGAIEETRLAGAYDLVIMNQLIEHVWDISKTLEAVRAALKEGGRLSISTPNLDAYERPRFGDGSWGGYYFPRHLNLFDAASLGRVLGDHGFRVIRQRPLVAPLVWAGTGRALLKRRGWRGAGFFRDANLPLLALFACLDSAMMLAGASTANQQVVAERDPGAAAA